MQKQKTAERFDLIVKLLMAEIKDKNFDYEKAIFLLNYTRHYVVNFMSKKVYSDDLEYKRFFDLLHYFPQFDKLIEELTILNETRWVEDKLSNFEFLKKER